MKFKTPESQKEKELKELLKQMEEVIDDSYLTTKEARKVLDYSYSILQKFQEIKKARDNWRNKFEEKEMV